MDIFDELTQTRKEATDPKKKKSDPLPSYLRLNKPTTGRFYDNEKHFNKLQSDPNTRLDIPESTYNDFLERLTNTVHRSRLPSTASDKRGTITKYVTRKLDQMNQLNQAIVDKIQTIPNPNPGDPFTAVSAFALREALSTPSYLVRPLVGDFQDYDEPWEQALATASVVVPSAIGAVRKVNKLVKSYKNSVEKSDEILTDGIKKYDDRMTEMEQNSVIRNEPFYNQEVIFRNPESANKIKTARDTFNEPEISWDGKIEREPFVHTAKEKEIAERNMKAAEEWITRREQIMRSPEAEKRFGGTYVGPGTDISPNTNPLTDKKFIINDPETHKKGIRAIGIDSNISYQYDAANVGKRQNHFSPVENKIVVNVLEPNTDKFLGVLAHEYQHALTVNKFFALDTPVSKNLDALKMNPGLRDVRGRIIKKVTSPNIIQSMRDVYYRAKGKSTYNGITGDVKYFNYAQDGSPNERIAFLGEAKQFMINNKHIKDELDTVTPEMVIKAVEQHSKLKRKNRYARLFDFIDVESNDPKIIADQMNKILKLSAIIGGGTVLASQNDNKTVSTQ